MRPPFVLQYASHLYRSTFGKVLVVVVTGMFPIYSLDQSLLEPRLEPRLDPRLEPRLEVRCHLRAFRGFVPISGTPSLFLVNGPIYRNIAITTVAKFVLATDQPAQYCRLSSIACQLLRPIGIIGPESTEN